jgi:hypothetical protein
MAVLINVVLAVITFYLYVVASKRFYRRQEPFLGYLGAAVVLDIATALLASFKLTPTTLLPGVQGPPWRSVLFLAHISTSTLGMFGFITVLLVLSQSGKTDPTTTQKFQYRSSCLRGRPDR